MFERIVQDTATDAGAPGFAGLEARLHRLDKALFRLRLDRTRPKKPTPGQLAKTFESVQSTLELARVGAPELVERLCQHISVHGVLAEFPAAELNEALGQLALHDAYFWRLLARAYENRRLLPLSCLAWEQFRVHALDEGWFSVAGSRAAAIDLRVAGQLAPLNARGLALVQAMAESSLRIIRQFYLGQGEAIRALAPSNVQDPIALNPEQLCQRAAGANSAQRLAESALDSGARELAYLILGTAFKAEDADLPRLLALRARSLPSCTPLRILECLHVAVELARRRQDPDLVSEILASAWQRPRSDSIAGPRTFLDSLSEIPLSEDELTTILTREREATSYPVSPADDTSFEDDWDNEMDFDPMCSCDQCQERRRHSSPIAAEQGGAESSTWLEVDPAQPLSSLIPRETP